MSLPCSHEIDRSRIAQPYMIGDCRLCWLAVNHHGYAELWGVVDRYFPMTHNDNVSPVEKTKHLMMFMPVPRYSIFTLTNPLVKGVRSEICSRCPAYNYRMKRCIKSGKSIAILTSWSHEKCPVNKW